MGRFSAVEAVIFDMNGVIVDDEGLHFQAQRRLFQELGGDLTPADYDRSFTGRTDREAMAETAAEKGLAMDLDEALARKDRYYLELAAQGLRFFPGVREFVAHCGQGRKLAVASSANTREIALVLEQAGLGAAFAARVSAEDVERGKPDPQVFLLAAQRLGVEPARCLVVEDSVAGVAAARAAGMACLAVAHSYAATDLALADLVVPGFQPARFAQMI